MTTDDERQAAIKAAHVEEVVTTVGVTSRRCRDCDGKWPCDLAYLLAEVERLEAERAFFERNAHKATALAVEECDRENALKSEIARLTDENERLTLERDESVANMTAASTAFARLQRNAEAWNEDSKRLHNEYLPTSRIMDEVLATRDAALMKAWAERDAATARAERYRLALLWYADDRHYNRDFAPVERGATWETFDEGRKARAALAEQGGAG